MNPDERITNWQLHPSQRGQFGFEMYKAMAADDRIWIVAADLGYGLFDAHKEDFPTRFLNPGASEQAAAGICVGLALNGFKPFLYSITTFLLFRAAEWHRNYLDHEGIPVRLVGSGLDDDYRHDGITHHAYDAKAVLALFPRIQTHFPTDKSEVPAIVRTMIDTDEPSFLCLRR